MTRNKTKIMDNRVTSEASFSRKSSFKGCQVYVCIIRVKTESKQLREIYSACENKWRMQNEICSFKAWFQGNKICTCLVKNQPGTRVLDKFSNSIFSKARLQATQILFHIFDVVCFHRQNNRQLSIPVQLRIGQIHIR